MAVDLATAQRQVWANKQRQRFNTTDVPLELCLLQGEITEFFQAWRSRRPDVGEELADVAIYVLGLAEMVGVDLATEVAAKIATNTRRRYERRDGVLVKVADEEGESTAGTALSPGLPQSRKPQAGIRAEGHRG